MPDNKLVIRRLPPSMSEENLLEQLSPLPDHDYFCFFEANPGLGPHSFSRAYINFLNSDDVDAFLQRYDNHTFSDRDGHEYKAVVEQAMWHKSPKSGPFYKSAEDDTTSSSSGRAPAPGTIEEDPEFIRFIDDLQSHKKRPQQSPVQNLESSADELLSNSSQSGVVSGSKNHIKVVTPLINYVNQQRINRSSKKSR